MIDFTYQPSTLQEFIEYEKSTLIVLWIILRIFIRERVGALILRVS